MPKRIQRMRTKNWRMPENTVYVGRPTKWGNPFELKTHGRLFSVKKFQICLENPHFAFYYFEEIEASLNYEKFMYMKRNIDKLKGKDLACWCPLDKPCHADVLLVMANIREE